MEQSLKVVFWNLGNMVPKPLFSYPVCYNKTILLFQLLLRKKAAEELKKEQERKAAERRRIIEERCGQPKNIDDASEGMLILSYLNYSNTT